MFLIHINDWNREIHTVIGTLYRYELTEYLLWTIKNQVLRVV